ncbi:MAG: apolipoprotein N-acyltransferase [Verrucomicrobia bacterium]|nr:apolipoprotein N-acyltransferase [Verrucomicrobiota bacterium]
MKVLTPQRAIWIRFTLAIAAGLCLSASFPKLSLAGLAWIAPGCLLFVALGQPGGQAFRVGFLAGLAHQLATLHWLLFIPYPVGAVMGWLALSAYLALWPGFWVWLCWRLFPNPPAANAGRAAAAKTDSTIQPFNDSTSPLGAWLTAAETFVSTTLWQRLGWTLFCAAAWVAMEMIVGRFLSGFPWNFLGVSQYQMLPLIQIASVTGVYGVSFLVAWTSVSLACALLGVVRRPQWGWAWFSEVRLPLVAVVVVTVFGLRQVTQPVPAQREIRLALVQPSIPQTLIWDRAQSTNRFNKLLQLSELALVAKPDLLVWPEAAVPNLLRYSQHVHEAVTNLARTHRVWMIVGADDAEPRQRAKKADDYDYFNSSFLINPDGEIVATYRKQRLVIFGEYVPLARWLPFLHYLTPIEGGFTPGDRAAPFRVPALGVNIATLICFEDTFAHFVRGCVTDDTDFLLNLTNDAWFGESAEQWQHAATALFRAIENGLPLIRCTNNGLTCWIDARGRMHEVFFGDSPDIYGEGFKIARVPLPAAGSRPAPTFYRRHGDWFGWGCVAATALAALVRLAENRHRPTGQNQRPPAEPEA